MRRGRGRAAARGRAASPRRYSRPGLRSAPAASARSCPAPIPRRARRAGVGDARRRRPPAGAARSSCRAARDRDRRCRSRARPGARARRAASSRRACRLPVPARARMRADESRRRPGAHLRGRSPHRIRRRRACSSPRLPPVDWRSRRNGPDPLTRIPRTIVLRIAAVAPVAAGLLTISASTAATTSGRVRVPVAVPAANASAPFDQARSLVVPTGWRVEVWSRISGARHALWTPSRTLLVTATGAGELLELVPRSNPASPPSVRVLVRGLTNPQGLAFDTIDKQRVLYLAESNRIDRFVWRGNGTIGRRTVVVSELPDESASGDDVHRLKGIAVGPD